MQCFLHFSVHVLMCFSSSRNHSNTQLQTPLFLQESITCNSVLHKLKRHDCKEHKMTLRHGRREGEGKRAEERGRGEEKEERLEGPWGSSQSSNRSKTRSRASPLLSPVCILFVLIRLLKSHWFSPSTSLTSAVMSRRNNLPWNVTQLSGLRDAICY